MMRVAKQPFSPFQKGIAKKNGESALTDFRNDKMNSHRSDSAPPTLSRVTVEEILSQQPTLLAP
jgi:hypothetical protein